MRKAGIFLLCVFLIVSLASCLGGHELDDLAYVYSIGVDKGVTDKLQFSLQFSTMKGGGSSGGGGSQSSSKSQGAGDTVVMSVETSTFYAGTNLINASLSRTLEFSHAKYLVISEELARKGVSSLINSMIRSSQIRRDIHVFIARGSAKDFLKGFRPTIGSSVSRTQELMMQQQNNTGFFDDVNFNEFSAGIKNRYFQPTLALAALNDFSILTGGTAGDGFKSNGDYTAGKLPRAGGNQYEFIGTALFDGDKMISELNGDETRVMLMLKGEFGRGSILIPDPLDSELRVTSDTHEQKKPDIKIRFQDGKPIIHVKLFLEGDLQNIQSGIEYESEEKKPMLEQAFQSFIKDNADRTIAKCQNLNCDVFGFGETAAMHFLTITEWEAYDWLSGFKSAEVTTEVEYIIRRTGTLMKTSPSEKAGGTKK